MKKFYFVLLMLGFATGCQKSNDSPPAAVAHQFGMMGGSCYDYTAATYTAATNCPGMNSTSNYTMQNGVCVSSTGQQVATSFCSQSSTGYYMNNGVCYSSSTNQQVATSFCGTTSNLPPQPMPQPMPQPSPQPMPQPMPVGNSCFGNYIYTGNGFPEYGYCYGINCRGYVLIEAMSGRTVFCQ